MDEKDIGVFLGKRNGNYFTKRAGLEKGRYIHSMVFLLEMGGESGKPSNCLRVLVNFAKKKTHPLSEAHNS